MFKVFLITFILLSNGFLAFSVMPASVVPMSAESTRIDTLQINFLNQQCWSLRRTDPKQAIEKGKESLVLAKKIGYNKGIAQVLNYLGICYLRLDDSRTSSEYFFEALSFCDSLNLNIEKGYALNNIASLMLFEGDYQQALDYSQKSLDIQLKNNDKKGIAYSWMRMGEAYYGLQKYDNLLITAKRAYVLLKELKMKDNARVALKNIGRGWEGKKQYRQALNCYMEIINSDSISSEIVRDVCADLVRIYNLLKQPDRAIYYGEKWLSYEKHNDIIYKNIASAYAQKGNWKEAFEYTMKSIAVRDSLDQEEKFRQIKNLQILYETRETEKENANLKAKLSINNIYIVAFGAIILLIAILSLILLNKRKQQVLLNKILHEKNQEISIQRDHLDELNQTKDKLFSIIAHDLRGPIGSTSAFLEEITANESQFSKEELHDNLNLIKESSKATFKLLGNLLTWALAQKGEIEFSPSKNDLAKLVQSNIDLFASNAENKKIQIKNNLGPSLIFEFDREMINTVIRNLINNAIKYTSEQGQISVTALEKDDIVEICIEDTGIGMDSRTAHNLFITDIKSARKEGTKGEKGTGLGLILCKEFVLKHHGKIWAESENGKGSAFKFTLPRSQSK